MSSFYHPTGATPELIIQSLNDYLKVELSLPGTWSPKIFYQDLRDYPVTSKRKLAELVYQGGDYLKFFEESRCQPREVSGREEIWAIFSRGSLMLYFEPLFLELIEGTHSSPEEEQIILSYLKVLSESAIIHWNAIVEQIGACCYQFFGKEPWLYARLTNRTKDDQPEEMTDQELLEAIGSNLSPNSYLGKISVWNARSALIEKYKETH